MRWRAFIMTCLNSKAGSPFMGNQKQAIHLVLGSFRLIKLIPSKNLLKFPTST